MMNVLSSLPIPLPGALSKALLLPNERGVLVPKSRVYANDMPWASKRIQKDVIDLVCFFFFT
jgi:hypothetical protein